MPHPLLTIRASQLAVFRDAADNQLGERLRSALRRGHSHAVEQWSDAELGQRIAVELGRARELGLDLDTNRAAFATLSFEIGAGFEEYPPFAAQLAALDATADENFERLLQQTFDDQWDAAKRWLGAR